MCTLYCTIIEGYKHQNHSNPCKILQVHSHFDDYRVSGSCSHILRIVMIILTNERQVSDQIENPLEFLNYSINEAICTCFHEKK